MPFVSQVLSLQHIIYFAQIILKRIVFYQDMLIEGS